MKSFREGQPRQFSALYHNFPHGCYHSGFYHEVTNKEDKSQQEFSVYNLTDLTLMLCSFNTPDVVLACLRSWVYSGNPKIKLFVAENSTDDRTLKILQDADIRFVHLPSARHDDGVNELMTYCQTKHVLLVDSDVIFLKQIFPVYGRYINTGSALAGEYCDDRAGMKIRPRMQPWFCFIDSELWSLNNWKMGLGHDMSKPNSYDTGSLLYESVTKSGRKITDLGSSIYQYIRHFEGMSWRYTVQGYQTLYDRTRGEFLRETAKLSTVNINGFFLK